MLRGQNNLNDERTVWVASTETGSALLAQKQWFTSRCTWGIFVQQEGRVFVRLYFSTAVQSISEHGVVSMTSWSMKLCWTAFVFWALSVPTVQGKLARLCESNSTTVNKLHNTINVTGGYVLVNYSMALIGLPAEEVRVYLFSGQNIILAASRGNPCWCWWRYALAPVRALLCAFPCSLFAIEWYACGSMMFSIQRNRMVYKGQGRGGAGNESLGPLPCLHSSELCFFGLFLLLFILPLLLLVPFLFLVFFFFFFFFLFFLFFLFFSKITSSDIFINCKWRWSSSRWFKLSSLKLGFRIHWSVGPKWHLRVAILHTPFTN